MEASGKVMAAVMAAIFGFTVYSHVEAEFEKNLAEVSYAIDHAGETQGYGYR